MFKKPIIISLGCSFSDATFKSHLTNIPEEERGGWPIWSDHIKNKLEIQHKTKYWIIHFGKSGSGNEYALKHITECFAKYKDRIKFVLWGGTEFHRYHHELSGRNFNLTGDIRAYPSHATVRARKFLDHEPHWGNSHQKMQEANVYMAINYAGHKSGVERLIHHGLQLYWTALMLCQKYNATLLMTQLLSPIYTLETLKPNFKRILEDSTNSIDYKIDRPWEIRKGMKSPFFKDLHEHRNHFFNLRFVHIKDYITPPFKEVDHWTDYIRKGDNAGKGYRKKYLIRPHTKETMADNYNNRNQYGQNLQVDTHPNAAGHKNIADQLWKHYEANFL